MIYFSRTYINNAKTTDISPETSPDNNILMKGTDPSITIALTSVNSADQDKLAFTWWEGGKEVSEDSVEATAGYSTGSFAAERKCRIVASYCIEKIILA